MCPLRWVLAGTLYIVATPIGNLEDITQRALRILREADLIACEDTRHTRRLLEHYGIRKPTISYHDHNEIPRSEDLISKLLSGLNIAIVSDAGTPLIADPGYRVVSRAAAEGVPVISVPGPSAVVTALAGSGLPTDSFYFGGFLPSKRTQRRKALSETGKLDCTLIFYEAPHRLIEAISDLAEILGDRDVVICRELTKLHEEWIRGTALSVAESLAGRGEVKGEVTLLIGKARESGPPQRSCREAFDSFTAEGLSRMDAIKAVARERGVSKREVYAELESANP